MTDRTVLVTGGAGNIGSAVTRIFLEKGAYVAVPYYKPDPTGNLDSLRAEFGDRLHTFALDLTTERGANAAVQEVVEWRGALDSVVHMMGGYSGGHPLAETPVEVWDRMMDLNLKSAWLITRAAVPALLQSDGGTLVFVSSRAARQQRSGRGVYSISKAGLLILTEAIMEEYGQNGIRANAVLPGVVDTEANREAMPDSNHDLWTPPEQIAQVILFLSSDDSAAITGAAIPVYGQS